MTVALTVAVAMTVLQGFLHGQVQGQACTITGWFGPNCQYQCHCTDNTKCDGTDGLCTNGAVCDRGWFGPACQYKDLVVDESNVPRWYSDRDGSTCYDNDNPVTVDLGQAIPFTWLRVDTRHPGSLTSLTIQLQDRDNTSRPCSNQRNATITGGTMDIHCDVNFNVRSVRLYGVGVRDLCSVYISGGRNVALKQHTSQSGYYRESIDGVLVNFTSDKAVDGDTNGYFYGGQSCTATDPQITEVDPYPEWSVTLDKQYRIGRVLLFNRDDNYRVRERLQGFILTAFDATGDIVFNYTDTDAVRTVYEVIAQGREIPVARLQVQATKVFASGSGIRIRMLTLCEVEAYGDVICPAGRFGRACEHTCYCHVTGESCFVSTGDCPSGCRAGYTGEGCNTPCPVGQYGVDCAFTCSPKCASWSCDRVDGRCLEGCQTGYKLPLCVEVCDPGQYGTNCSGMCSTHCIHNTCDVTDGFCSCDPGHRGVTCDQACPDYSYGQDCQYKCSSNCIDNRSCDKTDGRCPGGCVDGYKPPTCFDACANNKYGKDCISTCSQFCQVNRTVAQSVCDHTNGACLLGCVDDVTYSGPTCQARKDNDAAIIGGTFAAVVVLLLVVVVVLIVLLLKRRRRQSSPDSDIQPTTSPTPVNLPQAVHSPREGGTLANYNTLSAVEGEKSVYETIPDNTESSTVYMN